jgi:rubrerythrin
MCPICGVAAIEIRAKLVCPKCHMILETCCEGGRCG